MPFFNPTYGVVAGYVLLFLLVAPLFPFLYLVIRSRADGRHEPGMGTHGAFFYFAQVSLLLFVASLANLTYGWMSTTDIMPFETRLSWGMFSGSLLFFVLNVVLLLVQRRSPMWRDVRRVFWGFLLVMAGLVTLTMTVMFFITVFFDAETDSAKELRTDEMKLYGAWAGYFLLTYVVSATLLLRSRPT